MLKILLSLGFPEVFFVPSCGSSGGIALLWKNCLAIQIVSSADNFIIAVVSYGSSDCLWHLTGIYGPTNPLLKPDFWDTLTRIGETVDGPWCVGGDFNAILEHKHKLCGRCFASGSTLLI